MGVSLQSASALRIGLMQADCGRCQLSPLSPHLLWTVVFKDLDPIPQFRATAKLGAFLEMKRLSAFHKRKCGWHDHNGALNERSLGSNLRVLKWHGDFVGI